VGECDQRDLPGVELAPPGADLSAVGADQAGHAVDGRAFVLRGAWSCCLVLF
jgi:hypothetical protein